MLEWIFWSSFFLSAYCYFLYPFFLYFLAGFLARPVKQDVVTPTVSILISVYNEASVIEQKIRNLLSLDYPQEKIEIIIGSDGSTDGTNDVVQRAAGPWVRLVTHSDRRGKAHMVNDLVAQARHEIIVFNDARQIVAADALKEMVKNFADQKVGCVSGELMLSGSETGTGKGVNLYWRYEKFIRRLESRIHSMLGATGAIYAIRRTLFTPIPADIVLDDMWVPLQIILRGYRAIFDDRVKIFDTVAEKPEEEHRRKVRTLYGNYQLFAKMPQVFNPLTSPIAVQIFSHKFLRLMVPFFMIIMLAVNALWLRTGPYPFILFLQVVFYGMALLGSLAKGQQYVILKPLLKVCYVPYVFCLLNFSALAGFVRFLRSDQDVRWEKARGA